MKCTYTKQKQYIDEIASGFGVI